MALELTDQIVLAGNKLRVAQAEAKERYKSYSAHSKTVLEVNREVLKIRGDLARKEAELLDFQSQAMEAQELFRVSNGEVAKWDAIIRRKHVELIKLGRSTTGRNSDTRIATNLMVEELLLSEPAVQTGPTDGATGAASSSALADLARVEADKARKLRQQVEQEEKRKRAEEAENLRKAREEKLRKAEAARKEAAAKKAREAEEARARAAAELEERQRQEAARLAETENNLRQQLTDVQLQMRMVTSQANNGARRRVTEPTPGGLSSSEAAGAECLREDSKEVVMAECPTTEESEVVILHRIGRTNVGTDEVPHNSQEFW